MATFFSIDRYPGNGVQTVFDVTFPYLSEDHVFVSLTGAPQTKNLQYIFISPTQIQFFQAPAAGSVVVIERDTSSAARLVDYQNDDFLGEIVLDTDSLQAFFLAQENTDATLNALTIDPITLQWDAQDLRIEDLAEPSVGSDAATKTYADNIVAASGNVPPPGGGEVGYVLTAQAAGVFGWDPGTTLPPLMSSAEVQAGVSTDARLISAEIVKEGVLAHETGQINPAAASQAEAETGTETDLRSWSPLRVAQAAAANAPSAFTEFGVSGLLTWAANSSVAVSLASLGLSGAPAHVVPRLVCVNAAKGYAVGDVIYLDTITLRENTNHRAGHWCWYDGTNVGVGIGNQGIWIGSKTGGIAGTQSGWDTSGADFQFQIAAWK